MKVYKVLLDNDTIIATTDKEYATEKFRQAVAYCEKHNKQGTCIELIRKGSAMPIKIKIA